MYVPLLVGSNLQQGTQTYVCPFTHCTPSHYHFTSSLSYYHYPTTFILFLASPDSRRIVSIMNTPRDISFRCSLLLAYTALAAHQCHAFSSYQSSLTLPSVGISSPQHLPLKMNVASSTKLGLFGQVTNDDEDHSCPSIVVIKTHEDYVKFLEEDDRLCVVK